MQKRAGDLRHSARNFSRCVVNGKTNDLREYGLPGSCEGCRRVISEWMDKQEAPPEDEPSTRLSEPFDRFWNFGIE